MVLFVYSQIDLFWIKGPLYLALARAVAGNGNHIVVTQPYGAQCRLEPCAAVLVVGAAAAASIEPQVLLLLLPISLPLVSVIV